MCPPSPVPPNPVPRTPLLCAFILHLAPSEVLNASLQRGTDNRKPGPVTIRHSFVPLWHARVGGQTGPPSACCLSPSGAEPQSCLHTGGCLPASTMLCPPSLPLCTAGSSVSSVPWKSSPQPASCPPPHLPGLILSIIHSTKWIFNLRNEMTLPSGRSSREGVGKTGATK